MYDESVDFSKSLWKSHKREIIVGATTISVVVLELNGIPVTSFALSSAKGVTSVLTKEKNEKGLEKLGFKNYGDIATSILSLPKDAVGIFQFVDKNSGVVKYVSSSYADLVDKNGTELELFYKPFKSWEDSKLKSFEKFMKDIFNLN